MPHELSSYNFISIYIWKDLFDFFYLITEENLCIFAKNKIGTFMYLPPQGKRTSKEAIETCFKIMDGENESCAVSRIENIEKNEVRLYESMGFKIVPKDREYVCRRNSLVELKGDRFKSKRAASNYFLKNYCFSFEDFKPQFKEECLELYLRWVSNREAKYPDPIYGEMLKSSFFAHKKAMENFHRLALRGKVLKIDDKISGYTFGYPINKQTFCVCFEITDLKIKGASQFIFRKFCSEIDGYDYINIMDDSGLVNLRRTKLSYHPYLEIESFIAKRDEPRT